MHAGPPSSPQLHIFIGVVSYLSVLTVCPGGYIDSIKQHPAVRLTGQFSPYEAAGRGRLSWFAL